MTVQHSTAKDVILFTKASRPTVPLSLRGSLRRRHGGAFPDQDCAEPQDGAYISRVVKRTVLRRRFTVITRIVATAIVSILALGEFWWDTMGVGGILNPLGFLFLLVAAIIWFEWDLIRDAFATAKNESNIPMCHCKKMDQLPRPPTHHMV